MMTNSPSDKMKKKWSKDSLTLLPCFYFVELPIVASSVVSLYFLESTDVLGPPRVGFRCHDRHLSKPYVDGGDEIIPLLMLLSLAFAGPAASIMLVEAFLYMAQSRSQTRRAEGGVNAGGCNFNSFLRRTVRFVGVHVFGLCATALVTDIIQLSTGYHAPFFLTVCKPNYSQVSCDTDTYVTRDICSGPDRHAIAAARKTFPSQHATLSAFAAVYVSMYFNSTVSDGSKLLKPVLVFLFVMAAALSGLTQITQHRSHPVDIYVGFLIGAFIAAYLALNAVANFESSDAAPAPPPPPAPEDPLRALTERGHESVYDKGPASASESNDEIAATPDGAGSLKRAGVDVELMAPRSPMAKETMLTFGNTLPRSGVAAAPVGPVAPTEPFRRVPKADPAASRRLPSEWMRKARRESDESASDREPTPPPPPAAPRPPQVPQAGPPPVSPKTSSARAKWSAIREKALAEAVAGRPRPLRASEGPAENSSESAGVRPSCRQAAEKRREAVVAADAFCRAPPNTRERADERDAYDPDGLRRGDCFRPTELEVLTQAQREEMAARRKTALVLLERDAHLTIGENHLRSFQGRRIKD
ncbi:phospholipid phosphatase-related protein type 3 [Corythoichthys intestinalis]|uniref:phospholipid phosphatase-related protein type 3 n=1 Tax=Corythoichthys intestinalis TaxID=161448 RepID=UPI0025A5C68F|nr:phospholipid phosphatase-related protein type 3 [Corythoichthys intestinalis]XP_057696577.1 phospholipid phosphatase-related protein type 3 [Corythoichthys intestinalis]XP_061790278.1 phospholipid phosphatase-related protein type 3-like [Nerophis lumbriciformis]